MKMSNIRREWEVFAREGAVGIGAVRDVSDDHIVIYIEGFGDQRIGPEQIASVHDGKVVLDVDALPKDARDAIRTAHDEEDRVVRSRPPVD